ncbi:ras-related protein Rab-7L1-like [Protopterus annectens]|uniref:ras-related protein Rab-7L1-like n=1 Tax=Protopterus annectens TaxID=7888 RepID=UPI001CF9F8F3|nr:ras-related protein Rab-7L1-like [Protopterus annectens]
MPTEYLFKVIVIGRSNVGKTAFVNRCVKGCFTENYKPTIGVDFAMKTLEWSENEMVRIQFWDIQGQEDTLPLSRAFFKGASACVILFDITSEKSFHFCKELKAAVDREVVPGSEKPVPCLLLANKCDLPNQVVEKETIATFCTKYNFGSWKEISVKENIQIEESVRWLVQVMMKTDSFLEKSSEAIDLGSMKRSMWSSCCGV